MPIGIAMLLGFVFMAKHHLPRPIHTMTDPSNAEPLFVEELVQMVMAAMFVMCTIACVIT